MASKRILDKRREHEAAEKQGKVKKEKTKAPAKAKAVKGARKAPVRKRKTKAPERKRLLWGVFSGTLKEEGRFPYNEKNKAEEKLAQLRAKSKKLYFIQPIKESISDSSRPREEAAPPEEEEVVVAEEEAANDDEDDVEEADEEDDSEE